MVDRSKLYDNPRSKQNQEDNENGESWTNLKTGKPLSTKRGDEKEFDGKRWRAIGHISEKPEQYRSIAEDEWMESKGERGHSAGSGTLRGNEFDTTTNDGVMWKEMKQEPTS